MNYFIRDLKNYRGVLPKNIIKTLKGQALSGQLAAAKKGLETAKEKYGGSK